jgi:Fe-S-cluster containining protein
MSPELARAIKETRAILAFADQAWAKHGCPASGACCQLKVTGRPPWLWPTEWALLEAHLAKAGRTVPPPRADGGCVFLDTEGRRCTVYEARPFGCRTYFCEKVTGPNRQPAEKTNALLERLAAVNLALDDQAKPRALPELFSGDASVR